MKITGRKKILVVLRTLLLILLLIYPFTVFATIVSGSSTVVSFSNTPWGIASVKIAAPGGAITTSDELTVYSDKFFPDGDYQYELSGELLQVESTSKATTDLVNGRASVSRAQPYGVIDSGDFRIVNGVVFDSRTQQETN